MGALQSFLNQVSCPLDHHPHSKTEWCSLRSLHQKYTSGKPFLLNAVPCFFDMWPLWSLGRIMLSPVGSGHPLLEPTQESKKVKDSKQLRFSTQIKTVEECLVLLYLLQLPTTKRHSTSKEPGFIARSQNAKVKAFSCNALFPTPNLAGWVRGPTIKRMGKVALSIRVLKWHLFWTLTSQIV